MSYHIVHILKNASRLSIDRGSLVCASPGEPERRMPKADILAVIIAARGALFTGKCLADLLENGSIILHCDENFRPVGKSVGLHRVIHSDLFEKQIERHAGFSSSLWNVVLRAKIKNQAGVLARYGKGDPLIEALKCKNLEESKAAKMYWAGYFKLFKNSPKTREHRNARAPANKMLNYGYAVLGAVLHRSMTAHGLNATLGIHHKYRFKADPFLYDLMEPLRPFCDLMLVDFLGDGKKKSLQDWARHVAAELINNRIEMGGGKKIKLLYAVDKYVCNVVDCYLAGRVGNVKIPEIPFANG